MADTKNPNLPSYTRPEVEAAQPDLELIHDELGGTRRMHAVASKYIRKWKDEEPDVYNIRKVIEEFDEMLGRTLSASVGMLYAKPPQIEWNASESTIKPQWDNIDARGTKGSVLVKRFTETAIADGIAVILVDHTAPPTDATGQPAFVHGGNEKQLGLRPTWAFYSRAQIVSWRTATVSNETIITQIVFRECGETDDGAFGVKTVVRYRVVKLFNGQAMFTLWEQLKEDASSLADFRVVAQGFFRNRKGVIADFLPISIAYTGRTNAPMTSTIPLLGVAWQNLGHWRQSTNLRFYRELSAFPQPTVEGNLANNPQTNNPMALKIGPAVVVQTQEGAKFSWTEIEGKSMDQLEKGIDEKARAAARLGMSFMARDTRAPETAEAKRLDSTAENSTLATSGQGVEDAVNTAFEHHAWYEGIEKIDAPEMMISRDFDNVAMDPQTMTAYVDGVVRAGLPARILLEAWQQGGRLPAGTNLDVLEAEMLAGIAAREEQKRLDAEAQANPNNNNSTN